MIKHHTVLIIPAELEACELARCSFSIGLMVSGSRKILISVLLAAIIAVVVAPRILMPIVSVSCMRLESTVI